jgi:uncharacterized integral membrane protein
MDESERTPPEPSRSSRSDRKRDRSAKAGRDDAPETPARDEAAPSTPLTQQIGRVVVVLLLVLFVVFAVDNSQRVDFSWVLGETVVREDVAGATTGGVPLIVLLVASFVVGALVATAGGWQVRRARRRDEGQAGTSAH